MLEPEQFQQIACLPDPTCLAYSFREPALSSPKCTLRACFTRVLRACGWRIIVMR